MFLKKANTLSFIYIYIYISDFKIKKLKNDHISIQINKDYI